MSFRLVQQGEGNPRPLVVLYLVGAPVDSDLREALGQTPAIAAYDEPVGEALSITLSCAQAKMQADVSDVILVGYSAGCKAVRRELMNGFDPAGVFTIDGTHADLPPLDWQIQIWQTYAERARRSERLFVATCTQNTYVETSLPKGGCYSATVSVLRRVTGYPLEPSENPAGEHDGALHVYSFSSAPTDRAAHGKQQTEVLPALLARHAKPWLNGQREMGTMQQCAAPPFTSTLSTDEMMQAQQTVTLSLDKWMREMSDAPDDESTPPR